MLANKVFKGNMRATLEEHGCLSEQEPTILETEHIGSLINTQVSVSSTTGAASSHAQHRWPYWSAVPGQSCSFICHAELLGCRGQQKLSLPGRGMC